jgi:RNA polymerase sigma factor RpoE
LKFPGNSAAPIEMLELDFVPGVAFARSSGQLRYTENRLGETNEQQPREFREGRRMSERDIDRQLVERAQHGDKHAFELLVSKYQRKLGRLLSRFIRDAGEVEDVTQEAFVKAYRALPSFRGDSAFYTWLYRIGINTAKNYLTSMGRRAPTSTNYDSDDAEAFDDGDQLRDLNTPENLLMSKQIARTVNQSMDRLPEELRTAIMLREIEGMSYEDIAKIMGCPIGTVRSRIFRAREAIAQELRPLLDISKDKRW